MSALGSSPLGTTSLGAGPPQNKKISSATTPESLLEMLVLDILTRANVKNVHHQKLAAIGYFRYDFFYQSQNGHNVVVEVKRYVSSESNLAQQVIRYVSIGGDKIDHFFLLTPEAPQKSSQERFLNIVKKESNVKTEWIGIKEFEDRIFRDRPDNAQADVAQRKSIQEIMYNRIINSMNSDVAKKLNIDLSDIGVLLRYFSPEMIEDIFSKVPLNSSLESLLGIGKRLDNCVVLLSDIKNFSKIVKATSSDTLKEIMLKYYAICRDIAWRHGGVLDKFIGDAALIIFNYPNILSDPSGAERAVRCAADLIYEGNSIIKELEETRNDVIDTGTRIGISTGQLSILEIGKYDSSLEISFIGDVINLAARLEGASKTNGILIDQLTRNTLNKEQSKIPKGTKQVIEAKGQSNAIKCWQMSARTAKSIWKRQQDGNG